MGKLKQPKKVYLLSNNLYNDVECVCLSMKAVNRAINAYEQSIIEFAKSEEVKTAISKGRGLLGEREIVITSNVPTYAFVVSQTEIIGSENLPISEIGTVWVSYCSREPGQYKVFMSREQCVAHLKSINCLRKNGQPMEGNFIQELKVIH